MNTKNLLKFAVVMLVSVSMVFMSCVKEDDPAPTPSAYVPTFNATSQADGTNIVFAIICITDNFTFTRLDIIAPTGASDQYVGTGQIVLQNSLEVIDTRYPRLSGNWTFKITGTVSGGANAGVGFISTATVNVSAK